MTTSLRNGQIVVVLVFMATGRTAIRVPREKRGASRRGGGKVSRVSTSTVEDGGVAAAQDAADAGLTRSVEKRDGSSRNSTVERRLGVVLAPEVVLADLRVEGRAIDVENARR